MSKSYSFLVVDDEEAIRDGIVSTLESVEADFTILEAVDGADALRKISVQKFDLVITDLNMPKMDGHKLIQQVRENVDKEFQPKHYLIVSSNVDPEDVESDVSILNKPFSSDDLMTAVKKIFSNKKKSTSPKKKKKATNKINVDFINPFIDATLEVLDIMCSTKAEKDFVFVKEPDDSFGDISGVIPIRSANYLGSMAITFPESVYLKVMSNMMGEEYTQIDDENRDGVAELCNQIFGNAKGALVNQGYELDMTIPKIVCGEEHIVEHEVDVNQVLAVYFKTEFGSFVVECVLTER